MGRRKAVVLRPLHIPPFFGAGIAYALIACMLRTQISIFEIRYVFLIVKLAESEYEK